MTLFNRKSLNDLIGPLIQDMHLGKFAGEQTDFGRLSDRERVPFRVLAGRKTGDQFVANVTIGSDDNAMGPLLRFPQGLFNRKVAFAPGLLDGIVDGRG